MKSPRRVNSDVRLRKSDTINNLWESAMTYDELAKQIEQLSYRDKFRLAQLLIQLARKEEEEHSPEKRQTAGPASKLDPELIEYVANRLRKLRPSKKEAA